MIYIFSVLYIGINYGTQVRSIVPDWIKDGKQFQGVVLVAMILLKVIEQLLAVYFANLKRKREKQSN